MHLSLICISKKKQTKLQPYDLVWIYLYTLCLNEWKTTKFIMFAWIWSFALFLVINCINDISDITHYTVKTEKEYNNKVIGSNLTRKHLFSINQDNFSSLPSFLLFSSSCESVCESKFITCVALNEKYLRIHYSFDNEDIIVTSNIIIFIKMKV